VIKEKVSRTVLFHTDEPFVHASADPTANPNWGPRNKPLPRDEWIFSKKTPSMTTP